MSSLGVYSAAGQSSQGGRLVINTPLWVTVVRGMQAFIGFIILILSGLLIHGLALGANVFALVCGLFTFVAVGYAILAEKVPSCQRAYNIWALLATDLLMAIFWLSSMGANAALRATFVVDVEASCYDDGSAVNAGHCVVYKRTDRSWKRAPVASQAGLAEMSAVAGLSALEMLLFIATLVYIGHVFRIHRGNEKARNGSALIVENKGHTDATPQYQHQYHHQHQHQYQESQSVPYSGHMAQELQAYDSVYSGNQQYPPYR